MSRIYFSATIGLLLACASAYEDPVPTALGIAGDENAEITGELGKPLNVRCLAYGYPPPDVYWYHGQDMVPFNDPLYLARGTDLLIRSLSIETLGVYTCQAWNVEGATVSWRVTVKESQPNDVRSNVLAARNPPTTRIVIPITLATTTTERPVTSFHMPVSVHIRAVSEPLTVNSELNLICEIDGFPEPQVYWSKDNVRIHPDDRTTVSSSRGSVSRLVVTRVTARDGGLYACHARNDLDSDTATTQITVKPVETIPATCSDSPYYANCLLIVRSNYCRHPHYRKFCCKSCVEAGLLDPNDLMQSDDPLYRRK